MGASTAVAYITLDLNGFRSRKFYPDETLATYPKHIYTIFPKQDSVTDSCLISSNRYFRVAFDKDGRVVSSHRSSVICIGRTTEAC